MQAFPNYLSEVVNVKKIYEVDRNFVLLYLLQKLLITFYNTQLFAKKSC